MNRLTANEVREYAVLHDTIVGDLFQVAYKTLNGFTPTNNALKTAVDNFNNKNVVPHFVQVYVRMKKEPHQMPSRAVQ